MDIFELLKNMDMSKQRIGGGVASALLGSIAATISSRVAEVSKGKDCGLSDNEYEEIIIQARSLSEELKNGAIRDRVAYDNIVSAFKLPKNSVEEKAFRRIKINDAAYEASVVPLENGKNCLAVKQLSEKLMEKSNPSAYSDIFAAFEMSKLGVKGCVLNVKANYPLIKNEERLKYLEENLLLLE